MGTLSQAYPDRVLCDRGGHGNGIEYMRGIIHDFIRYNENMRPDFAQRLRSGLSTWQFEILQQAAAEASSRSLPIYVVGGLLRDLVLGADITDFDLVVEGDAILLARALASKFGGAATSHPRFGTAKWTFAQFRWSLADEIAKLGAAPETLDHVDLISARSEEYARPAALPHVSPGGIDDDLRRRDFTINTLAVRLDGSHFGEVYDPFGALEDLERGIIRVLHAQSFRHDPTRMYRAVRYEQRYGFKIASETLALVGEARAHVGELSAHRIRNELDRILDEGRAASMLRRLARLDLLRAIHGDLPADGAALRRLQRPPVSASAFVQTRSRDLRWLLWLIGLSATEIRSLNRRLHFRKELLEDLLAAAKVHQDSALLAHWRPSRITTYLDAIPSLAVYGAQSSAPKSKTRAILGKYLDTWRHMRPSTTGKDLKRLGLAPGPAYRSVLGELRRGWLDGLITSPADERMRLEALLRPYLPSADQRLGHPGKDKVKH